MAPDLVPPGHNAFAVLGELRGGIAAARGSRREANALLEKALAMLDPARTDLRPFRWRILSVRGMLALQDGLTSEAVADAERALVLAHDITGGAAPSYTMGRSQLLLGQTLAADGRASQARSTLSEAVRHLEGSVGKTHPGYRAARDLLDRLP